MTLQSQTELIPQVVEWVREHRLNNGNGHAVNGHGVNRHGVNGHAVNGHEEITENTNLLESGALDSFGFVELLLFIETLSGTKIDLTEVDPGDFAVLGSLCRIALPTNPN